MALHNHPLRNRVVEEMHLRRMPALVAPTTMIQIVRLVPAADRDAEAKHIAAMPVGADGRLDLHSRYASGRSADGIEYLWERHSEASTTSLIAAGASAGMDATLREGALWLEDVPGGVIRATRITIVGDEGEALSRLPVLRFDAHELVSFRIGQVRIWSDFKLHDDGYGRLLVSAGKTPAGDLGRLVQRLQELGNYRNLALLGLPMAQAEGPKLAELEQALTTIAGRTAQDGESESLLHELGALSAAVASIASSTGFRMSATAAYAQIVENRLMSLPCIPVPGFQSLAEFNDRRLLPAVRTCASFVQRLETLSVRIERATSLLRTRVDLTTQAQNVELLRSMDANAARQLRLQHLVEGLSVVAVSYYALALLSHFFPMIAARLGIKEEEVSTWAVLPVVLVVAAFLRWRSHRVVNH